VRDDFKMFSKLLGHGQFDGAHRHRGIKAKTLLGDTPIIACRALPPPRHADKRGSRTDTRIALTSGEGAMLRVRYASTMANQ
jgi:hypothetical protein